MKENALKQFDFRPIGNPDAVWTDTRSGKTLAAVLTEYNIIVDDRTQFARLYDYDAGYSIWYRAYDSMRITLTIYPIN